MARFSRPRSSGRSVASAPAREHQVSTVRSTRTRSFSRYVVLATKVQRDAWIRTVESQKSTPTDLFAWFRNMEETGGKQIVPGNVFSQLGYNDEDYLLRDIYCPVLGPT